MTNEVIHIDDFESMTEEQWIALRGHYIKVPKYSTPIYVPKRDANGVAILPKDWYEPYDDDD